MTEEKKHKAHLKFDLIDPLAEAGPPIYLTYDYNMRIKMETVRSLIRGREIKTVLDAPCGSGEISVPLIEKFEKITLIDASESNLNLAADKVPNARMKDVSFVKGDINEWSETETYDLVICLDGLSKMDRPDKFLTNLTQQVSRGGYIILQNTDSAHPYSFVIRMFLFFRSLIGKDKETQSWISQRKINKIMKVYGFMHRKTWRYNQRWIGLSHLVENKKKYAATRAWYGRVREPRMQLFGSDVICMFKRL